MTDHTPKCPLCGGASRPRFNASEYVFYRCQSCRTAFVDPVPSDEALTRFYHNYHLSAEDGGSYVAVEDRMEADFPAKIALVRSAFGGGTPRRLIDVGCGKGYFVKACDAAGIKAEGVDLSGSAIDFAQKSLGIVAHAGALHDLKHRIGKFDAATFWATIEHLPKPVTMLKDIAELLEPGGRLFLDTGIGDDWLDRLLPGTVQWYDPPQHLYVFSKAGIAIALESAGFRIERIDTNFERSATRRITKALRNGITGAGLRIAAELGRTVQRDLTFVRFPMGNLLSVTAVKI